MSGSDGLVDIVSGDKACAYAICLDGTQYAGSKRFTSSKYATFYRSELGGIKGLMDIGSEHTPSMINQTCDNESAVDQVNKPFRSQS